MSNMIKIVFVLAGLVLGLTLTSPAHADQGYVTGWPMVLVPAYDTGHAAKATPNVIDIQVQGKPRAWHLRGFAQQVDRAVGGLRIHYGAGNSCKRFSGRYCITVKQWYYPHQTYWGQTNYRRHGAVIRLNTRFSSPGNNQWAAGHEFLHALGEQHHKYGHGMLHIPTPSMQQMSHGELRVLRQQYGR